MRFLLIYPPSKSFFIETKKIFYGMAPPLGLLHIARVLEDEGDVVTVLDFSAETFDEKKLAMELESVDVVGITILTISLPNVIEIISLIKEAKPEIPVIIGGPHCTLFPKKVLEETQADICVQGDGEKAVKDIKKALKGELNYSEISGIFY
ncbi:MAG: cobalamin-dependent protein, partial [Candidatus Thermoplasmatota archaeon]|nr:cobalamin-dependent protein [Candidatus Thermoplasmatota archaeon]